VRVAGAVVVLCVLAVLAGAGSPGFALGATAAQVVEAVTGSGGGGGGGGGSGSGAAAVGVAAAVQVAGVRASAYALGDIPSDYLGYYITAAKTCKQLGWQLLAGIGKVESDHGRSRAPGVTSGVNRFGCCAGPMQFNLTNGPPSTWDSLKRPGDDVYDPADAIPAAARKLCHDGLGEGAFAKRWRGKPGADPCPQVRGSPAQHRALRRYNNACWYAQQVLVLADRYTLAVPDPGVEGRNDPFLKALLGNDRVTTTATRGCDPGPDLASGRVDPRVVSLLAALAERHSIRISCLASGHSRFVKGTSRVSNHTVWRAVDIDRVDGRPVAADAAAARALVAWLDRLDGPLRPVEIGSPFGEYAPREGFFTDLGHQAHIHIGYGPG